MSKPRLSVDDIDQIVHLLTIWRGELTWNLLVAKVAAVLGRTYTRQALDGHADIKRAFAWAKASIREERRIGPKKRQIPEELAIALQRVEALNAVIVLLKQERNAFLETFAIWQYNARNRGLSESDLNQPLPEVQRDRTDTGKSSRAPA